jgi:uncharacterized protein
LKYLLVLVVVGVALWLMLRGRESPPGGRGAQPRRRAGAAATMVACAHCGLHLPAGEAVTDAAGRAFCSDAHRLAGPR